MVYAGVHRCRIVVQVCLQAVANCCVIYTLACISLYKSTRANWQGWSLQAHILIRYQSRLAELFGAALFAVIA